MVASYVVFESRAALVGLVPVELVGGQIISDADYVIADLHAAGFKLCPINPIEFVSATIVGSGVAQSTPHGLGATPSKVMVSLVGGPLAYVQPVVTPGAHTNVNVIVTVTLGWSYQIFAKP